MTEREFDSVSLQKCLDRWQAGDSKAADELLRATMSQLESLARRMTRSFPNIRSQTDSSDVLQSSLIRLLRTLKKLRPATTRDFFNLAAVHIRRELIDIAGRAKRKASLPLDVLEDSDHPAAARAAVDANDTSEDFDLWVRFHEAVDKLPAEEREVVGLVFYHGWAQVKIAQLFDVDERTIRRRWSSACERLRETVGVSEYDSRLNTEVAAASGSGLLSWSGSARQGQPANSMRSAESEPSEKEFPVVAPDEAFDKLRLQYPQFSVAWERLKDWFTTNGYRRFIQENELAQQVPDIDAATLAAALEVMTRERHLVRTYQFQTPDGGLIGPGYATWRELASRAVGDLGPENPDLHLVTTYRWGESHAPA